MNVFLPRTAFAGGLLALALLPAFQDAKPATPAPAPAPTHEQDGAAAKPAESAPAAMMAKVGEKAPDFTLQDLAGDDVSLRKLLDGNKFVVLEWFNPDCPVSKAYHDGDSVMGKLASTYSGKGVVWVAINSGAAGKQGAGHDRNVEAAKEYGIKYPVLLDESGAVGKHYGAKTTPHMFVIDKAGVLRYAGAIDDGGGREKGKVNYVSQALDELLAGKAVSQAETRAFGCSVKYAD